ncbi:nuclear pore complex protein [Sporothrix brasiliensis 5110]|uniref:Nuclear pore complex protein n=1 Tax=Sporothrix brasiliensis 5110 TaxID=1398154 RepID=A0A0C2IM11_9PEZI|nr:nuclear pore complex protein [Sporothrix brasiliensis 5110]KIH88035.1 nuclear pore complex protein [Sporothrix brasiliensis 5110]
MAFRAVATQSQGMQTPQRQVAATAAGGAAAKATPSRAAPSTPILTDSPGNWRHPRMDEITRRRAATVFTETNLKTFVYNVLALVVVFLVGNASGMPFTQLRRFLLVTVINTALLINMARSLLPLFRKPDTISDIPLTPGQRKLLGLPALKTSATPNAVYTTPPRYTRTPSVSGSAASIAAATHGSGKSTEASFSKSFTGSPISGSPLFAKARPANGGPSSGSRSGSPFSPSSPFQNTRKASFGSPGTLGGSANVAPGAGSLFSDSAMSSIPGTPSPTGKRLSMGLNNKWLYEKGRRTSGGSRLY